MQTLNDCQAKLRLNLIVFIQSGKLEWRENILSIPFFATPAFDFGAIFLKRGACKQMLTKTC